MKKLFNKIYDYLQRTFYLKELIINLILIIIVLFLCFYEFQYVIYKPGGAIKLNDRIYISDKQIDVGNYNMAYVSVAKANSINLLLSKIKKNWDTKKIEDITIKNTDYDTTFELEKIELQTSINTAIINAFNKADKDYEIENNKNIIYTISDEAKTDLKPLDEIKEINNKKFDDVISIKKYINTLENGEKITIKVIDENGKEKERYAKIYEKSGNKLVGVVIYNVFDLITNPKIEIKSRSSEAGASGGLMMSLALYDSLTKGDLTHKKKIVGTGTIDMDGNIGEIGGVKYKLLGAEKENADIFFIPEGNYKEAKKIYKKYELSFKLVKVSTFDDAINYLNKLK